VKRRRGDVIVIGGNEKKHDGDDGAGDILRLVAERTAGGRAPLVVLTVATGLPDEVGQTYRAVFRRLGVKRVEVLDIRQREEAFEGKRADLVGEASVLFFTGGDQLRITSQLGGTPLGDALLARHRAGATIAGTSAGAAAMAETMLVGGPGNESRIGGLALAPGLGIMPGVIIDSHFAQRGRFGRLLGAVVQNPHNIGLGIDEDTAFVVQNEERFQVLGSGAVYVFDGSANTYTTLSDLRSDGVPTIHDVRLHVLGAGAEFDLRTRRPARPDSNGAA
jgi:cyanophycinase